MIKIPINPHYMKQHTVILREIKSFYDKLILSKYILKEHDICALLDADIYLMDYSFLSNLRYFHFKKGIST